MLISSPEFTLIELDLAYDTTGGGGARKRAFTLPGAAGSSSTSVHPYQNNVQSVRQGVRLIVQNIAARRQGK